MNDRDAFKRFHPDGKSKGRITRGVFANISSLRGVALLTEQEISRAWRALFRGTGCSTDEAFTKAEQLLDELRPESPLRHRLGAELEELRHRANQEA